ncbi:MAG: homoserine O-succinyltransferase [Pseudomonadota bacterium]
MPLVAHSALPSFQRLKEEGGLVIAPDAALHQDIREMHIGLLNMMPDAALAATERQFFRLVGESNQIAQFYVHPFTLPGLPRGAEGQRYVEQYYESFDDLTQKGLDALIITGANVTQPNLSAEPFWQPLIEVIDWAYANVTSTLCSCLATHAVMEFRYGQKRRPMGDKRWGVYAHRVVERRHPLVCDVNTRFDVPHSRYNDVSRAQFEAAGVRILVESAEAGVHLAVSEDLFRLVFFQGHPEYDTISLLKEFKREIVRYFSGARADYPPFPENYFCLQTQAILREYQELTVAAKAARAPLPALPEDILIPRVDNTWHDTAEAVIDNWIGKVYQITNQDRRKPFMPTVHPDDPLGMRG